MGTAYAVWGGIGAIGTVLVGMLWFGEPATTVRMLLLLGLVGCIVGLRLTRMSIDEGLYAWVQEALEPLGRGDDAQDDGRRDALSRRHHLRGARRGRALVQVGRRERDAIWDEAGCERFTFTFKDGRVETMNYRRAPSDVYDDAEAMQRWAALAVEAAGARRRREEASRRSRRSA